MSTHSAGRRAAVKAGSKPVHFSLDGCPLFRYFSGSVATLRDTLSTSRSVGRGTGAFIYLPPFSENSPIFCSFPFAKIQSVFLPEQTGRMKHRTSFSPSATPAGITHYTLQAKSCAKGVPPFGNPRQQNRLNTSHFPVLDVQPLFVVSSPFHGLPFVPLSIVFPCSNRLAGTHAPAGRHPLRSGWKPHRLRSFPQSFSSSAAQKLTLDNDTFENTGKSRFFERRTSRVLY